MIKITWLGQGGFLLEVQNYRLVIDPYLSDNLLAVQNLARLHPFPLKLEELRPDCLVFTHDHLDHLDPIGVKMIRQAYPRCRYYGTHNAFEHLLKLEIPAELVSEISPGCIQHIGPFTLSPTFASHSDPFACGYLIEAAGKKIVISGDTNYDERLLDNKLASADLMLICINGKLNNMNSDDALKCVRCLTPAMALPMHIGLFAENTADPMPFVTGCRESRIESFSMIVGKEFEI